MSPTCDPQQATQGSSPLLGWLAILGAWLCFGSFAVPMKWIPVMEAQVHPLVFQCYKTFWTFITSHAVLLFLPYEFSVWGIASGFSWVPAGIAAVVAVQHVGIACGQAVWQVVIIMASFAWGFLILDDEAVKDVWGTTLSCLCLCSGVVGMTVSFNLKEPTRDPNAGLPDVDENDYQATLHINLLETPPVYGMSRPASTASLDSAFGYPIPTPDSVTPCASVNGDELRKSEALCAPLPRRSVALGLGAAIFNGLWGGSNLVPSHFAPYQGVHFVISFATGALIANVALVIFYIVWIRYISMEDLPNPHFRVMALPGFVAGSLWSAGNFCSLYAVQAIGQGIGYSLIQSSVIVSGCWGIFYYKELQGWPILLWFASMAVCTLGIVGLAVEKC